MKRWIYPLLAAILLFGSTSEGASAATLEPVFHAQMWINGRIVPAATAGRVVILDVFTVDCVNCRNVAPLLRRLYRDERGRGLQIVGIHAPETPAEKQRAYVVENLEAQGIVWPVAIDNEFALWRAYGIDAWPTQLIFDRRGRLRKVVVGDSQDAQVQSTVLQLLAER